MRPAAIAVLGPIALSFAVAAPAAIIDSLPLAGLLAAINLCLGIPLFALLAVATQLITKKLPKS